MEAPLGSAIDSPRLLIAQLFFGAAAAMAVYYLTGIRSLPFASWGRCSYTLYIIHHLFVAFLAFNLLWPLRATEAALIALTTSVATVAFAAGVAPLVERRPQWTVPLASRRV